MEVIKQLYKGFIITDGKKPKEKLKDGNYHQLEQVISEDSFAGVLKEDVIVIDIDKMDQSEILMNIIDDLQLNCYVYQTKRGRHFIFKNHEINKNATHIKLAIGLEADIKCGKTLCYQALKVDGQERFLEWDCDYPDLQQLPKWLFPVKSKIELLQLSEGDGRNDLLYRYILDLLRSGLSKDEAREVLRLINKYIFKDKLDDHELNTIMRDEAFPDTLFFDGTKFKFDEFAKYLKTNDHVCKINGILHIFDGRIYVQGTSKIESKMVEYIPTLKASQRKEVIDYLKLISTDNISTRKDANYIAFKNGIYDIEYGNLLDFSHNYHITNLIPHDYNPAAYNETVDMVLDKMSCNDLTIRSVMEEAVGYCFYRKNELSQTAFIFLGDKANGKSTFLTMIKKLLGKDNYSALDLEELDDRFSTIMLSGKLANIGDDLSDNFLSGKTISTFKKVTSGNTLKGEFKGQDIVYFEPYCKMFYSTNDIARMKDNTGAVMRRLQIIPMNAYFTNKDEDYDPYIIEKLTSENAMEYLINIALKGLARVMNNKGFTKCSAIDAALNEFDKNNNPVRTFIEELGENDKEIIRYLTTTDLLSIYLRYQVFCEENGFKAESRNNFTKRVCKEFGLVNKVKRLNGKCVRMLE